MHAPVATFAKPQPLLLAGSLHEVLVQREVVTDRVLEMEEREREGGDRDERNEME